jgi:hypothetical protein
MGRVSSCIVPFRPIGKPPGNHWYLLWLGRARTTSRLSQKATPNQILFTHDRAPHHSNTFRHLSTLSFVNHNKHCTRRLRQCRHPEDVDGAGVGAGVVVKTSSNSNSQMAIWRWAILANMHHADGAGEVTSRTTHNTSTTTITNNITPTPLPNSYPATE